MSNSILSLTDNLLNVHETTSYLGVDTESIDSTGHFIQFYESDRFLVSFLTEYLVETIRKGNICIMVLTNDHKQAITSSVTHTELVLIEEACNDGRCIFLNAHEVLTRIDSDEVSGYHWFTQVIGPLIRAGLNKNRHVTVYGEIGSLLRASENENRAIQLENILIALKRKYTFSLICTYLLKQVGTDRHTGNQINVRDQLWLTTQLQRKTEALEIESRERKKLEKQNDTFVGIVSHELKTPVTSIKAYAQILQRRFERLGDHESARCLRKMNMQLTKLTSLIHDLLDVTNMESGRLQLKQRYFDLNKLATEVAEAMQLNTSVHRIEKHFRHRGSVYGDRNRVGKVITNLLSNAIKYSPYAGRILISTNRHSEGSIVSVQDFGCGIRKENQDNIFTRFYRVEDNYEGTYHGLGLGLYIGAQIVNQHGGRLWVESEPGRGSTFSFLLPSKVANAVVEQ